MVNTHANDDIMNFVRQNNSILAIREAHKWQMDILCALHMKSFWPQNHRVVPNTILLSVCNDPRVFYYPHQ